MIRQIPNALKAASILGTLLLASTQAMAQLPPAPPVPPGFTNPLDPTGSDLMVAVWDEIAGVSLIENLGFKFNQFTEALVTPESGGTINFGTLTNFNTVFGGSQAANINYMVFSGLNTGSGASAGQRQLLVSRLAAAPGGTITNVNLNQAVNVINTFYAGDIASASGCDGAPGVNPCTTNALTDVGYAGPGGGNTLGPRFANNMPIGWAANTVVGTSLDFYQMSNSSGFGNVPTGNILHYGNSTGFATWLLTAGGNLTYTLAGQVGEVPLPAAVWLLFSGLAGFGAVARRRKI
jgi:hypothetical protein